MVRKILTRELVSLRLELENESLHIDSSVVSAELMRCGKALTEYFRVPFSENEMK